MLLSTARVEITPTGYTLMGGYGSPTPRNATSTYSPLWARAVVLWDAGTPHVIVSADLLGIPPVVDVAVRAGLNLPAADLVLLASHTHNGPLLPQSPDPWVLCGQADPAPVVGYADWLVDELVSLVQAALSAPQITVTLDYQVASQSWSYNRAGLPYVETAVPVLVARKADGLPAAVLFSYGTHPVCAGNQTRWDGDFPAAAAAVVEAAVPGCVALFVPGPAGDQDPAGTRGWPLRNKLGAQLGAAVVTATTSTGRVLFGISSTSHTTVNLPLDITDTPANLAVVRGYYVARASSPTTWYARHAQLMIDQIDGHSFATTVALPLTGWKLGGSPMLRMAFVGGEVVSGYAVWARNRWGGANGVVLGGYANTCPCYVPSNALLPPIRTTASYEGGWDNDYPGIAGGSMTIYPHLGHFKAGAGGAESALIAALTTMLD